MLQCKDVSWDDTYAHPMIFRQLRWNTLFSPLWRHNLYNLGPEIEYRVSELAVLNWRSLWLGGIPPQAKILDCPSPHFAVAPWNFPKRTMENNSLLFSRTIAFCSPEQYPIVLNQKCPPPTQNPEENPGMGFINVDFLVRYGCPRRGVTHLVWDTMTVCTWWCTEENFQNAVSTFGY